MASEISTRRTPSFLTKPWSWQARSNGLISPSSRATQAPIARSARKLRHSRAPIISEARRPRQAGLACEVSPSTTSHSRPAASKTELTHGELKALAGQRARVSVLARRTESANNLSGTAFARRPQTPTHSLPNSSTALLATDPPLSGIYPHPRVSPLHSYPSSRSTPL